jgi:hypothetical protein
VVLGLKLVQLVINSLEGGFQKVPGGEIHVPQGEAQLGPAEAAEVEAGEREAPWDWEPGMVLVPVADFRLMGVLPE